MKSMKFLGAELWSTLKVIKRILNSIRRRTVIFGALLLNLTKNFL